MTEPAPTDGAAADSGVLERLHAVIESRRGASPSTSYTAKLLARGRGKISKKLGEEAAEVIVAALSEPTERLVEESADLLFHLLVLWAAAGVRPADVWQELAKRQGVSGLVEKAKRQARP
jgi:phosphoribosyl-ATP pyrophosphohydrolase